MTIAERVLLYITLVVMAVLLFFVVPVSIALILVGLALISTLIGNPVTCVVSIALILVVYKLITK